MSERYKIHDLEGVYFITITVVDWVDAFTRREHKLAIIRSPEYCQQNKGLLIHAWCLMPSHLHMIVSAAEGYDLSAIIRDFKKFSSKEMIERIKEEPESRRKWMMNRFKQAGKYLKRIKNYKFWQDGFHPIQIWSEGLIEEKLNYIHQNPVEDMTVQEPQHYLFSSAIDYADGKGLLDVLLIK